MDVETQMIEVPVAGGAMPAFRVRPKSGARAPGVLVIQEAFGLNEHIKDVARRIAGEGYVAPAPATASSATSALRTRRPPPRTRGRGSSSSSRLISRPPS